MSKLALIFVGIQPMRSLVVWLSLIVGLAGCSKESPPTVDARNDAELTASPDSSSKTTSSDNRSVPPTLAATASNSIQRRQRPKSDSDSNESGSESESTLESLVPFGAKGEGSNGGSTRSDTVSSNLKGSAASDDSSNNAKSRPAVEQTLKTVATLREKSRQATNQKDSGKGFLLLTQAWEAARENSGDPRVKIVMNELTAELTILGKQANQRVEVKIRDRSKMLTEQ